MIHPAIFIAFGIGCVLLFGALVVYCSCRISGNISEQHRRNGKDE